jgi:hypothetical protein
MQTPNLLDGRWVREKSAYLHRRHLPRSGKDAPGAGATLSMVRREQG